MPLSHTGISDNGKCRFSGKRTGISTYWNEDTFSTSVIIAFLFYIIMLYVEKTENNGRCF